jgi:hypothetical protein
VNVVTRVMTNRLWSILLHSQQICPLRHCIETSAPHLANAPAIADSRRELDPEGPPRDALVAFPVS